MGSIRALENIFIKNNNIRRIAMFDNGFFGGLFDFNNDDKLDIFERAADTAMFMSLVDEASEESDESDSLFDDDSDDF